MKKKRARAFLEAFEETHPPGALRCWMSFAALSFWQLVLAAYPSITALARMWRCYIGGCLVDISEKLMGRKPSNWQCI
jgi:hypothetical protein